MASGLPDFYRGVDIAYQALAEMIVRPKYGGAQVVSGTTLMTASTVNTLATVAGKGMVYGGFLFLDHTSTQKNSYVTLLVDGIKIAEADFEVMNDFNLKVAYSAPVYLLLFDDVNFKYCMGYSPYTTFETGFTLKYEERHGSTPTVTYNVYYALI